MNFYEYVFDCIMRTSTEDEIILVLVVDYWIIDI